MLVILLVSLFTWGCSDHSSNSTPTITISTLEIQPNTFTQNGEIVGIDADVAKAAMINAGVPFTMEVEQSADDAFNKTLNGPNHALLTIAYSQEREDLYKWAGPTSKSGYFIFSKVTSGVGSTLGPDGARNIESIAVVSDWQETTALQDLGFENLVYYATYEEAIAAFLNDEVVAMASDGKQFAYRLQGIFSYTEDIDVCFAYDSAYYYIAFSKDVDDATVAAVQNSLETMMKNGEVLALQQKYFPNATTTLMPDVLQLLTEVAPPFNFYSGSIIDPVLEGSSIDIVAEIQKRNGYAANVNITGWLDGYNTVQYLPNSALFTTARTAEREDLFQWVGPISTLRACFYTLADSGITISNLEQAKTLQSIATPSDWYTEAYLQDNDFTNIVATSFSPIQAFNQLLSGEVEAIFLYDVGIDWLCDTTGTPRADIVEQFEASYDEGYIAFSLNTPSETVQQWQSNLDAMKAEGTFETLWDKWYAGAAMPVN